MDADFWRERWEQNQLGFHQEEVNPLLTKHWPALEVETDAPVFVPLCGKSLDMIWLRSLGHPVVGVELSEIACRDFFGENGLEAETRREGAFEISEGSGYRLHCGDFFALEAEHVAGVRGVFDRGSLVALPPGMRVRYAQHMARLLEPGARILLFTVVYDQNEMKGPPHCVPDEEVESLFGEAFAIDRLATNGPYDPPPMMQARGMTAMSDRVWRLERRGDAT